MNSPPPHSRPAPDALLLELADYVARPPAFSDAAYRTASHCLLDTLGCAMLALQLPACSRLLGPVVPGTTMPLGARVPGTDYELDPVTAAFDIGCCAGWLDLNDNCLSAERIHPSDNLGALLAVADWVSRNAGHARQLRAFDSPLPAPRATLSVRDLLGAIVKAYEIHGVLAQENSFSGAGLDHVLLVRIASTAVATQLLGGTRDQIVDALSHAWLDGSALRLYRHAPNAVPRQRWAAGDATSRAVLLALRVLAGEPGCPTALTAPKWGFQDALLQGRPLTLSRSLGSSVMEQILFKISSSAEPHLQTALEAAGRLQAQVAPRFAEVERVEIATHEAGLRFLDPPDPLASPGDRKHSLPFLTALGLVFGRVNDGHFEDAVAHDPRLAALCARMHLHEDRGFSLDYRDPDKHALANAVQVFFRGGTHTERVVIEYPLGHHRRRVEGLPLLFDKAELALRTRFDEDRAEEIVDLFDRPAGLESLPVDKFMAWWVP
jgi:2-methylcitrate dehydratase